MVLLMIGGNYVVVYRTGHEILLGSRSQLGVVVHYVGAIHKLYALLYLLDIFMLYPR
jgi:hypothetical protein